MNNNNYLNRYEELKLRTNAIQTAVGVLADSISILIRMADKENGKTLSRRFTNKVQEEINARFGSDSKVLVSMSYEDGNYNEISFYLASDRSYQVPGRMGGYTGYVDSELYTRIRFP